MRIVYIAISLMCGPLWVTREAGLFKKHDLDVELVHLSGGTLSTPALVSGDVQIAFTGEGNMVSANLTGAGVVLLGATIDLPDVIDRFAKAFVEGIDRFKSDKSLALATIEKYTKTTAETEQIYEIYAQRYTKRAPEVSAEGMQTVLEEIGDSRPLPTGIAPQRFIDSRAFKELNGNGFVDALYRGR